MDKIVIAATLGNFDPSYSLVTVILNQARLFKKYTSNPIEIWVLENCSDDCPEDIRDNVVRCIPVYTWESGKVNDSMIPKIQNAFQDGINRGAKHILCHDLIFQDSFLTYNEAIRRIAGINSGVRWYHFTHSGPHPRPSIFQTRAEKLTHTRPCNSKIVFLNYLDLPDVAQMYEGTRMCDCATVYNPMDLPDPTVINDSLALNIADSINFRDSSIRIVYPFSTTRMHMKQVHYVMEIASLLKAKGESVKFIACNCHANGTREKILVEKMISKFTKAPYVLSPEDILFTSMYDDPTYDYAIPHETVVDLFKLSNLFIFPTMSECCPLVLLEAAATNNLIISNQDVPSLVEMTGPQGALFFKFGSIRSRTCYGPKNTQEDRFNYFNWICENIIPELNRGFYQTNALYHVSRTFTHEAVWKKQLKPLLNL